MNRKILSELDVASVIGRYRKRINELGVSFDSLKSGSPEKQHIRHAVHASSFRCENPSVLDIGCGLGGFLTFLKEEKISASYTGYDIIPEYIQICRTGFPEAAFETRNVFENGIDGMYDHIVLSQVLNNRYAHSDNMEVMKTMMELAFKHARLGVSIDMMSDYVDFKSDELFYYHPEEIFSFAKTLTRRVLLRHDFRPFEFCIQLFQPGAEGFVP